jgi:hypothetical protein
MYYGEYILDLEFNLLAPNWLHSPKELHISNWLCVPEKLLHILKGIHILE